MASSRRIFLALPLVLFVALANPPALRAVEAQSAPAQPASVLPPLKYAEVSASVTMLQNERPYGSNITCIATKEGLIFVDASLFTEVAAKFRKDMEAKYQKKTLALLLSHAHTDHFFGMGAFSDVPVFLASSGREYFEQQLGVDYASRVAGYERVFPRFGEALKTARLFMPGVWFEKEMQFGSGENMLRVHNTGGHSLCSSYAYLPSQRVLVAGDNVQVDAYPYFGDPTGEMDTWIKTLKGWEAMPIGVVCPGHGRPVDRAYLTSVRIFFEDLVAAVTKLKGEKVPEEQVVNHPSLPKGYWGEGLPEPGWYRPTIAGLYRSIP